MSESVVAGPDPIQPFACDGSIGEEKLYELLAAGGEYPALDFKSELDLSIPGKKMDFIKDCAAMMNLPRGGYIVVGADDNGAPAQGCSQPKKEMFDSAKLVQSVKGYVDGAVDIRAQVHLISHDGAQATMAVIYVAPPADGFPAVMSRDGTTPSQKGSLPRVHFRAGTVLTRVGTTNALVSHQAWASVLHKFKDLQRADSRSDVDALLHRFVQMIGSSGTPTSVAPDLEMDAATFIAAVRSTLDVQGHTAITRFLRNARAIYRASPDNEGRSQALNRIAAVATEAVLMKDLTALILVVDTLFELYKSHLTAPGAIYGKTGAAAQWLEIVLRVMAIGCIAVREGMYEAIPTVTLRTIGDTTYSYQSWIRHGLTEASRAGLLADSDGRMRGGGIIGKTAEIVNENPELRPDIPTPAIDAETIEGVLNSLCQFDFLWCCLSLAHNEGSNPGAAFYPSCSAYHQHRAMPALLLIENDPNMRKAVFGNIGDKEIADSIIDVLELARTQSWNFGGHWGGARELPAGGFTSKHARAEGPRTY